MLQASSASAGLPILIGVSAQFRVNGPKARTSSETHDRGVPHSGRRHDRNRDREVTHFSVVRPQACLAPLGLPGHPEAARPESGAGYPGEPGHRSTLACLTGGVTIYAQPCVGKDIVSKHEHPGHDVPSVLCPAGASTSTSVGRYPRPWITQSYIRTSALWPSV